ncbi:MAG: TonB family protein [Gemmatimonadaceae bacterium]
MSKPVRARTRRILLPLWSAILIGAQGASEAMAQEGQGGARGVVLDSLGGAISSASISIAGSSAQAVTDAQGRFRFSRLPAGEARFLVRRLGFQPGTFVERIAPGGETIVEFRLAQVAGLLPTVEVRRPREVYDSRLSGYVARKSRGVGHFISRDYLDRHDSPRLADVLRTVPGLTVKPLRRSGGGTTVSMRGNCSPLVFLDGFPATAGPLDLSMIDLASVEGIEVYSGIATVPSEFISVRGGERCGVIAIWSRPARPRQRRLVAAKSGALEQQVASRAVYTAAQVDERAILAPGTAEPAYPDTLWRAGVGGRVVAEFVVDERGAIESGSFGIVSSSHAYFNAAVRSALEGAVFRAAKMAGQNVKQLVQLPFVFNPAAAGGPGPPE